MWHQKTCDTKIPRRDISNLGYLLRQFNDFHEKPVFKQTVPQKLDKKQHLIVPNCRVFLRWKSVIEVVLVSSHQLTFISGNINT